MAVSKRLRMEILRRDNYTCRYCGGTAPDVKLTIDHVTPVTLGGSDDPGNLVTACADCNAGKSASAPDQAVVDDVQQEALKWVGAMRRAAEIVARERDWLQEWVDAFDETWKYHVYNFRSEPRWRDPNWPDTIRRFAEAGLTWGDLKEAVEIVGRKKGFDYDGYWRYFCGICWKRVNQLQEIARELLEAEAAVEPAPPAYRRPPAPTAEEVPDEWHAAREALRKGRPGDGS